MEPTSDEDRAKLRLVLIEIMLHSGHLDTARDIVRWWNARLTNGTPITITTDRVREAATVAGLLPKP